MLSVSNYTAKKKCLTLQYFVELLRINCSVSLSVAFRALRTYTSSHPNTLTQSCISQQQSNIWLSKHVHTLSNAAVLLLFPEVMWTWTPTQGACGKHRSPTAQSRVASNCCGLPENVTMASGTQWGDVWAKHWGSHCCLKQNLSDCKQEDNTHSFYPFIYLPRHKSPLPLSKWTSCSYL